MNAARLLLWSQGGMPEELTAIQATLLKLLGRPVVIVETLPELDGAATLPGLMERLERESAGLGPRPGDVVAALLEGDLPEEMAAVVGHPGGSWKLVAVPVHRCAHPYFLARIIAHTVGHVLKLSSCQGGGCVMSHWNDRPDDLKDLEDLKTCAACKRQLYDKAVKP